MSANRQDIFSIDEAWFTVSTLFDWGFRYYLVTRPKAEPGIIPRPSRLMGIPYNPRYVLCLFLPHFLIDTILYFVIYEKLYSLKTITKGIVTDVDPFERDFFGLGPGQ